MKARRIFFRIALILSLTIGSRQEMKSQPGHLPFAHDHSTNGTGVCWGYAMGRSAGYGENNGTCNPNTVVPPNTKDDPTLWPSWSISTSYWSYTYDQTMAGIGPGDIALFGQHAAYVVTGHSGDQTISVREIPAAGGVPQDNTLTKTPDGQTFYYSHPSQGKSLGLYTLTKYPVNATNEFLYHNSITTNQGLVNIGGTSGTSPYERDQPWTGSSVFKDTRHVYPTGVYQVYDKWRKPDGSKVSANPLEISVQSSGNSYYAEFSREISLSLTAAQGVESGGTFSYKINNTDQGATWQNAFYESRDFGMPASITLEACASEWTFLNWSDGSSVNPRSYAPTDNATLFAKFKKHLSSSVSAATGVTSQRKMTVLGGTFYQVYESGGEVWYTKSTDNGSTWSGETMLSRGSGSAHNPSISEVSSSATYLYALWVDATNRPGASG